MSGGAGPSGGGAPRRWRRSPAWVPSGGGRGRGRRSRLALPFIAVVRGYQRWVSPWLPPLCRFYPSCSQYSVEAFRTRGAAAGLRLTLWRILRCNPFSRGGYDPVPPRRERRERER